MRFSAVRPMARFARFRAVAAMVVTSAVHDAAAAPRGPPQHHAKSPLPALTPQLPPREIATQGVSSFRFFSDQDGVPQSSIYAMDFDALGHLWIGTQGGPAFYDGRRWTPLRFPDESVSPRVLAVLASHGGPVWFGTEGGGLWRYHLGTFGSLRVKDGLPSDVVRALDEGVDSDGTSHLWVGTDAGLARSSADAVSSTLAAVEATLPEKSVTALLAHGGEPGELWVGTEGGLAHRQHGEWTSYGKGVLPSVRVRCLLRSTSSTGKEVLWVGTSGGLAKFEAGAWETFLPSDGSVANERVEALAETAGRGGARVLWVGTYGGGLSRLEEGSWTSFNHQTSSLASSYVLSLRARTGAGVPVLWVGTDGGGVGRTRVDGWRSFTARNSTVAGGVFAIRETGNPGGRQYWFGTEEGLAQYDGTTWHRFDRKGGALPNDLVYAVEPDGATGGLWVGTDGGLAHRTNKGEWTSYTSADGALPRDELRAITRSLRGGVPELLLGSRGGGVLRFENGRATMFADKRTGLASDGVLSLLSVGGSLFVGTAGGLSRYDGLRWASFTPREAGLPNAKVYGIAVLRTASGKRTLWVATDGGGIGWFELNDQAPQWRRMTDRTDPALPNNVVYDAVQDKTGRIYLSTGRGVVRLTPKDDVWDGPHSFRVETFTAEDGLPSNECDVGALHVDTSGRVWAGTTAGAAVLDPGQERVESTVNPLVIRSVTVDDEVTPLGQLRYLGHGDHKLEFEFALLSFFREADTQYRTQLVGSEKTWSAWTGDTKSRYTNIPAGSYTFRVSARDHLGNVSETSTSQFEVREAPWRTWWAFGAYALSVAAAVAGAASYRIRILRAQTRRLERKVGERTGELGAANERLESVNAQLARQNDELAAANRELAATNNRANRIFSALADALPGTILDGKYLLDQKIGAGGFAVVFRARHLALDKLVAVKVFRPSAGNDSGDAFERFRLEAVSACRVDHPNAIHVFDSGISSEGIAYIAMELLVGCTLAEQLTTTAVMSLRRTAQIIVPVCRVLEVAHSAGLIHRDVKPANIFLHQSGDGEVVKVVDFGIAKVLGDNSGKKALTGTGDLIGTPSYMAPERFGRSGADARSDVYSVAVMMYRMLSGRLPFDGDLQQIVAMQLTREPRSIRLVNPVVPERAAAVIMRALSKTKSQRPSVAELATEFQAALQAVPDDKLDFVAAAVPPSDPPAWARGSMPDSTLPDAAPSSAGSDGATIRTDGERSQS